MINPFNFISPRIARKPSLDMQMLEITMHLANVEVDDVIQRALDANRPSWAYKFTDPKER